MKKIEKFNFSYLSLIILLLLIIIISFFNFIDFFGETLSNVLIYIVFFVLLILNSFKIALKSKDKGIITGLKISSLITIIIIAFKLIFNSNFTLWSFIYILLIWIISSITSIYGANKKSSNS